EPGTKPQTALSEHEVRDLRELMGAAASQGTASSLSDLPGQPVLAKTGTAEHGDPDALPHTWIVGAQGDLAAAVFVEAGIGGAETAGPILREFLAAAGNP